MDAGVRELLEEQTQLLRQVQWDVDQLRLDNAHSPQNRVYFELVALGQRIAALELRVERGIDKLEELGAPAPKTCGTLRSWWRRAL